MLDLRANALLDGPCNDGGRQAWITALRPSEVGCQNHPCTAVKQPFEGRDQGFDTVVIGDGSIEHRYIEIGT